MKKKKKIWGFERKWGLKYTITDSLFNAHWQVASGISSNSKTKFGKEKNLNTYVYLLKQIFA